ncbi:uncharacterized protein LOC144763317 [Lissotriton helveticus]
MPNFTFSGLLVYRPTNSKTSHLPAFLDYVLQATLRYANFTLLGDFNLHVDTTEDSTALNFVSTLVDGGLNQLISGPTHKAGYTLDLICTNLDGLTICDPVPVTWSDHFLVPFLFSGLHKDRSICPAKLQGRNWSKISPDNLAPLLQPTDFLGMSTDLDTRLSIFNDRISTAIDMLAPIRPIKTYRSIPSAPWVVKLDLSLNELEELKAGSLLPFKNLSELDASLNALGNIEGVSVLPNLAVLNLNYNALTSTKGLESCKSLTVLNLSHNHVKTIRDLPLLSNLTHLHLDSNKLKSLDGVQNLPRLHELYVQNNEISSLLPLSPSLTLNVLDASNNHIQFLPQSLQVLRGLRRLKQLKLKGNPLARDNRYVSAIAQATSVEILDNSLLKNPSRSLLLSVDKSLLLPDLMLGSPAGSQMKEHLKESARESFMEKLQRKRKDVEGTIHHLHNRILDLQEELKEYEENLGAEMEGCIRYIDTIPPEDFHSIDPQKVPRAMEQYLFTKFWERWELGRRRPRDPPFKDLTKPEEVVKAAAWLLSNPPLGASQDST